MKKIILIIVIALCIFQIVVLATAIDIGDTASDRGSTSTTGTYIMKENPANESGTITSVEIWASVNNLTGCEVATFYVVSGNTLSTRDYETVDNGNGAGVVVAGSKQTFTVDLDVTTGDYIGIYFSGGNIERDLSGTGIWAIGGDNIPASSVDFSFYDNNTMSLYGTGETTAAFALVKFNNVVVTKWNELAISKWNNKSIP